MGTVGYHGCVTIDDADCATVTLDEEVVFAGERVELHGLRFCLGEWLWAMREKAGSTSSRVPTTVRLNEAGDGLVVQRSTHVLPDAEMDEHLARWESDEEGTVTVHIGDRQVYRRDRRTTLGVHLTLEHWAQNCRRGGQER